MECYTNNNNNNKVKEELSEQQCNSSTKVLLEKAKVLFHEEKLLEALELVRKVLQQQNENCNNSSTKFYDDDDEIQDILHLGELSEISRKELLMNPEKEQGGGGWKKQHESHSSNANNEQDMLIHYKVQENGKLKVRIDTAFHHSIFTPLIAVILESELFHTWMPKWYFPFRFYIDTAKTIKQYGKTNKIVQLLTTIPWPFHKREVYLHAFATDDVNNSKTISLKMLSVDENYDNIIPKNNNNDKNITRIDMDASMLFQSCPVDHPVLSNKKSLKSKQNNISNSDNDNDKSTKSELVLLSFIISIDPKFTFIPFINFCARIAIGNIWKMIFNVAKEIRDGNKKYSIFNNIISQQKHDVYGWIEQRLEKMMIQQ